MRCLNLLGNIAMCFRVAFTTAWVAYRLIATQKPFCSAISTIAGLENRRIRFAEMRKWTQQKKPGFELGPSIVLPYIPHVRYYRGINMCIFLLVNKLYKVSVIKILFYRTKKMFLISICSLANFAILGNRLFQAKNVIFTTILKTNVHIIIGHFLLAFYSETLRDLCV